MEYKYLCTYIQCKVQILGVHTFVLLFVHRCVQMFGFSSTLVTRKIMQLRKDFFKKKIICITLGFRLFSDFSSQKVHLLFHFEVQVAH